MTQDFVEVELVTMLRPILDEPQYPVFALPPFVQVLAVESEILGSSAPQAAFFGTQTILNLLKCFFVVLWHIQYNTFYEFINL